MKILSIHTGHDAAVALFEDYKLIKIYKEERLSRIKQDGRKLPMLGIKKIKKEIVDFKNIDVLLLNSYVYNYKYLRHWNYLKRMKFKYFPDKNKLIKEIIKELGLREDIEIYFYNHHFAHVIPTLYYSKKWNNTLLYSADGGGDYKPYGIYYFNNNQLLPIFEDKNNSPNAASIGMMYSVVTKVLGFKPNRHEGKITGLAAYGKYSKAVDKIKNLFYVDEKGIIYSKMNDYKKELLPFIKTLKNTISNEDLAYAAQTVLEEIILESIIKLHKIYNFTTIGLSGGVFANVKLNQKISELDFINDVFIFPPMGDEGLVIGGVYEYLIKKYGFENFLKNRKDGMEIPYWGDEYCITKDIIPDKFEIIAENEIVKKSVELLKSQKVCAIFTKGMEYGPRALGARSILINPSDRKINDIVNKRLNRTEFMPFAPYVRIEKAKDVFDYPDSSKRAMNYMTITCNVKKEWREKIQATVHVDNTARPQTIRREDNPLYYDILLEFEKQTGIPCLVNTSFNAHEEPIINTFNEALKALKDNRIDYLITERFIISNK